MVKVRTLLIFLCFLLTAGCASAPTDPAAADAYCESNDPWEPFNRKIFAFNMAADKYALRPVVNGSRAVTTAGFRSKVRTFLNNLKTPLTFVNDVLQLNFKNAGTDLSRFIINSTLGFFGVFDLDGMRIGCILRELDEKIESLCFIDLIFGLIVEAFDA